MEGLENDGVDHLAATTAGVLVPWMPWMLVIFHTAMEHGPFIASPVEMVMVIFNSYESNFPKRITHIEIRSR